jgi:hypothetical protein
MSLLGGMNQPKLSSTTGTTPSTIRPYTYSATQNQSAYPSDSQYGANGLPNVSSRERNYFNQSYTAGTPYTAANGGLMMAEGGLPPLGFQGYGQPQEQVAKPRNPVGEYLVNRMFSKPEAPTTTFIGGGNSGTQSSTPDEVNPSVMSMYQKQLDEPEYEFTQPELISGWQAQNPNAFDYSPKPQRYDQKTPNEQQLGAFKSQINNYVMQERARKAAEQAAAQPAYDGGGGANGGLMQAYAKGGKSQDDGFNFDDLSKAEKKYFLELMARPMAGEMPPGANIGPENSFEKYMLSQAPQGFTGRVGVTRPMDDGSSLRAGLSGIAMAQQGKQGVTVMPGAYDIGYSTPVGKGNVDLSAFRSINSMPGRGHEQGVNARYTTRFGNGGDVDGEYNLGGYSDGGRLLKGPGDGVSDDIPAVIGQKQPARLADGEFVIPARIVSELGNGSTDAGAKRLYAMMDRIQSGRKQTVGKNKVAVNSKATKHLPA